MVLTTVVLWISSMTLSLLISDIPFDISAPLQGMLLPFNINLLLYKLRIYTTYQSRHILLLRCVVYDQFACGVSNRVPGRRA